jgi:hypothetical protein
MDSHALNVQTNASLIHTEAVGILSHSIAIAYQNSLDMPDTGLIAELTGLYEEAKVKIQKFIDEAKTLAQEIIGFFEEVWAKIVQIASQAYWQIEDFLKSHNIII